MSTVINTNIQALNSQRSLKVVSGDTAKASEKLSSGLRINRAGDDAAGLAISEKMRGQIRGLNQASRNAQDGISLIQTAEGALQETHEMLQRMRELVVQASNDTNVSTDRAKISTEISQLIMEIDATAGKTQFNKKFLIDGSASMIFLQVGANNNLAGTSSQSLSLRIGSMNSQGLGVKFITANASQLMTSMGTKSITLADGTKMNIFDPSTAILVDPTQSQIGSAIAAQISTIDSAIENVSTQRAKLGAWQNRLEHTIKNLDTSSENLSASESRIRDTDMAKEMMNFTKSNVLSQAAQSMLAQANQAPNQVLSLLR